MFIKISSVFEIIMIYVLLYADMIIVRMTKMKQLTRYVKE